MPDGIPHQTAATTKERLAWSGGALVARRGDVAAESKAGCWVLCLGEGIDQLLNC